MADTMVPLKIIKYMKTIIWGLRLIAAVILLQTLYFKFTAHPQSVYIFAQLGIEPWGRIGSGVAELLAGILLLWPRFTYLGAILGAGIMVGAIVSHLAKLGISVLGDGGYLFGLACVVLISCFLLMFFEKDKILLTAKSIFKTK